MKKRLTAWLLTLSMLLTVLSPLSTLATDDFDEDVGGQYPEDIVSADDVDTSGTSDEIATFSTGLSLAELRAKFPAGKYWNHAGNPGISSAVNNQDGWTNTPCSKHRTVGTSEQTCNGFAPDGVTQLSHQCMGYAEKLGYDATGYNPRNNAHGWTTSTSTSSLNNLKPGDIVRFQNGANPHSIYITGVDGNTITYTDCNSDGHCIIRWDETMDISILRNNFIHLRSAPFAMAEGSVNMLPEFALDTVEGGLGKVHVSGWAFDPDDTGRTVEVRVSINGEEHTIQANTERTDVDGVYHCGANHGFNSWFETNQSGNVNVEVRFVDVNDSSQYAGPETRTVLVTKNVSPLLCVDSVTAEPGGVRVSGWAYDPDNTSESVMLHIYIGNEGHTALADKERSDLDAQHHCGKYHGFSAYLTTEKLGTQDVFFFAIDNQDPDRHTVADQSYTVNIPQDTTGPTISDIKVTDVSASGYTISCTVTDANGVDRVQFPTWATSSDDLPSGWEISSRYAGTKNGNTYTYRVNTSAYNNASGPYSTHIYAFDHFGNYSMGGQNKILTLPTGIVINTSSTILSPNKSAKLTATISPSSATLKTITWSSSNTKVATVSSDGIVKAVGYGTANITAKTENGKSATAKVTVVQQALSKLEVATMPNKTYYYVDEPLKTAGLTLKATYNDGTTKIIDSDFTCTPTKLNNVGKQTITVSWGGLTTTFDLDVHSIYIKNLEITSNPAKTDYYVGDTLDPTGLKLKATYNTGKTETISDGFSYTPTKLDTAGNQTITVTYGGKSTTFTVNVSAVALSSIAVASNPTKSSYYVGDTLDITGLKLKATYNNGNSKDITGGFTCDPTTLDKAGIQTITVTYGGKSTTFTVNVSAVALSSIAVASNPTKSSYYVGDTLDITGLKLKATYNNGNSKDITGGFTCDPTTLDKAGIQTITVTYGGKTTTFTVNVSAVALSSIAVASNPTKSSYYVGDTLDTTGLSLKATYNSGKTETISSDFTCTPTALNKAGTQTITVTYGGKSTTFTVNVSAVALSSIAVASNPTKSSYYVGDTLDITGLSLKATYNSGKTETISDGFSYTPNTLNTAGTQTITVTYGGKSTTFTVNVSAVALSSIAVASKPTKSSYYVGDTLDITGLSLKATYNSGKTETISDGFSYTPTQLNTAGQQTIIVTYGGKTTSFTVQVYLTSATAVSIKTMPNKTRYVFGDSFDPTGMVLTVRYNNNKSEDVTSGFTYSKAPLTSIGAQNVIITYGILTVSVPVTVEKAAQEAPYGLLGVAPTSATAADGKITGTTEAMEWAVKGSSSYTPCTEDAVTGLASGTYLVRYAQTATHYASATVEVTVPAYAAAFQAVTLTFDATDGVLDTDYASSKTVYTGELYGRLPEPTATGYVFTGWYTDSGKRITAQTTCDLTQDTTVYARWEPASAPGYTFDQRTGTLTIDCTGAMEDYLSAADTPWYSYRASIRSVVVKSGVTALSSYAFAGCENLTSVSLPDTLRSIGTMAFYDCDQLTSIVIPASVRTVGSYAFADDGSLSTVTFRGDAPAFGTGVFTVGTLEVRYPVYASGWETVIAQHYGFGGSIQWTRSSDTADYSAFMDDDILPEEPELYEDASLALDWTL